MRLALVIPCFNEEGTLPRLLERLRAVLPGITSEFEVVFVDDGSTDGTLGELRAIHATDPRFRYLALSRNFGKESAMLAGLSHARGDAVAILDADLQHPPELLRDMIQLLEQGYEQVVARRRNRTGDPVLRKAFTRLFYRLLNRMVDVEIPDGLGDFRLLSRKAVDALLALGEYNRFSKGLFSWIGFDTAVVDFDVARREGGGGSRWTFRRLLDYGIDGVVSFNNRPLRLAIHVGALSTLFAFGYAAWVLISALVQGNPVPGYVTTVCGVLVFGGLQLLVLGVIGEYLGRIYYETKRRPHFLVKELSPVPEAAPVPAESRRAAS
ncbi:glycosyltransferase family 2 protein [Amycolatopsis dongchuanensis]|uniref:Glycosyltransferase involved in cell wall bisynthesis n=3 Tax=Pseudonocardiaceae TaxID=2070 RepID=A0A1I3JWC3_9PSEU|nr:glycosyltransferase family 2 protein [Amycolatopsis sacchari]SFI64380.1 Glycosyltransferase involved in cell wall bisynthesis [Amycolatopsis sacchari]